MLQVLFQRTQNAWAKTIQTALRDDQGEDIFLDAPSFTTLAREKTASPILAVVLRIAACGGTRTRVGELLHSATSALRQFERGGGNAFIPLANDDYDDAVHAQALLRRESFRTGMLLSLDELAQLVHVPDRSVRDAALVRVSKRSKALPEHAQGHQHTLGVHVHRGTAARVSIATDARLAHTHMLGATGTGKSTLLLSLIAQDIAHGHPVFVLDPHGDLIEEVLARIPDERIADVCLFDPSDADADYPVGFNVLRAGSEVEQQLIASDLVAIFRRLATSWGDAMTTVLSNAVLALLEHPEGGTLVTLRRFLIDDAYRRQFLAAIPDREVRFFWEKEYPVIGTRAIGPILTRLDQFLRSKLLRRIVGQQSGKLDLGKMVDERRIVLCKLAQGAIGTENAHLLGSLLVSKLHQVALARQALPLSQRHSAYGYIDECQHFVSESMASLISEVRKYGVGFTFVHQSLAQLDAQPQVRDALLSIAHTRIMFRTGDDDAKKLAEGCAYFEASDLRSLARGEAIVRLGEAAHDFNLRVEPVEPVDEEIAEERRGAVRASSRARYATPRSELEDALPLPIDTPPAPVAPPDRVASTPLREPSAPVAAGTPPAPAPNVRRATRTAAAPSATTLGRGGKEHKYLQHLVKRLAEERGWRATIEDPGSEGASVDVVLRQGVQTVGVEISITTSVEHEIANLGKCAGLGFTRMLFIAKEPKKRERVRAASAAVLPSCPVDAIAPDDILSALDTLAPSTAPTETTVRGYTVRVSRQQLTPSDVAAKRKAVAGVIVRSLKPG